MKYTKLDGVDLEPEINFYKQIMDELNVVFDVGCRSDNIFYELNPNLEIHLFEPMTTPDIIELKETTEKLPNVHFNNYGVGAEKEIKEFYVHYSSLSVEWHKWLDKNKETVPIQFDTLYNYITDKKVEKIDLLKIDTEAWDFEVIKGAKDKIWDITYIQFEAGWPIYGISNTIQDILNYFENYNVYNIGGSPNNYVITKKLLNYPKIK
jgi:FkbM family methyltransferase